MFDAWGPVLHPSQHGWDKTRAIFLIFSEITRTVGFPRTLTGTAWGIAVSGAAGGCWACSSQLWQLLQLSSWRVNLNQHHSCFKLLRQTMLQKNLGWGQGTSLIQCPAQSRFQQDQLAQGFIQLNSRTTQLQDEDATSPLDSSFNHFYRDFKKHLYLILTSHIAACVHFLSPVTG